MPLITPFLWFDKQAEEAANFYVSIFKNSKVTQVTRSQHDGAGPKGSVLVVGFELDGQKFTGLNGGPMHQFNEAVSFVIHCTNQTEVDHFWSKLTADGGAEIACGWLKDKYGLRWQVVPTRMFELLADPDPARAMRATQAMMGMIKLDIAALEKAANG